ncbi:HAMP domain-containing sensor histidine kinase [Actinophytocola sp.]|uniref:sensor histidine kinase n=1 Tax=Actinophytocola sp. TaxID=1872138 RepID=UPI002D3AED47|nr:HAMP domain-containing sensor histidine kinase [Actinophytocola sp.]HYQ66890.1 HAMP domain-containing sensor histidine kinase [Actinophytocola sp.]
MSAANHWTPKLFPQSLRWRLSAVIALVAAVLAVALSLLVRTEFSRVQLADARRVQDERIQLVVRDYGLTGRAALGSRLDAPDVPRELLAAARGGRRATYLQRTANGAWIWAAAETDGHLLSLRSPYTDRDDALRQLDNALILGSAGVLVLASVLGVVLGARLSRRLRRAAVAARRVAEGDATLSVGEEIGTRPRDETAELAQAVDAVAAALRGRLAAEQRVTADIAHELRTPVTGLVTAAELLPPSRPAELVRDRVGVLRSLVEDILEVARLDTATEQAELVAVPLGDFVSRRVPVAVVEEAETVRTDPRRLERVLVNLLENAERHGSPPVTVHVVGRTIVVRDNGPGFPADLLREGPSRFRTADPNRSDGHGLGLTIAVAQARVLSAELTLANAADGGAEVTVALPSAP